ncbi:hypothetical protein [Gordonia sp. N1V]|uniref:hypothetical protein n=1 Tax=Gordonia sp. N1V TaxID=3034163 RepID=UPI0023E3150C|nr:hypothetical protein [Gordonia sp. N1V]MDF3280873.1 hypothetical protein [Gordonia sp. N1V]
MSNNNSHRLPVTKSRGLDLLREVLDQIHADASTWDQRNWGGVAVDDVPKLGPTSKPAPAPVGCGTAMCIAGHACVMAGDRLRVGSTSVTISGVAATSMVVTESGEALGIEERAMDLLQLDYENAEILFHASNSLEELDEMCDALERGEDLEPLH